MSGIDERLFGGDIHPEIKSKLVLRQELGRNPDFGEALDNVRANYSDIDLFPYKRGEVTKETDLSSRTPVARMWTALDILKEGKWKPSRDFPNKEAAIPSKERQKEDWERYRAIYRKKPDGKVEYKIIESLGRKVYVVGNNELNTLQPNESVSEKRIGKTGLRLSELFPDEQQTVSEIDGSIESQNNQFLKPPAGITSVSSETAGPGGLGAVEKITVNFIVHNFHDFDKIYSKYFMRPGAQIFVDIGWDTVPFYNPNSVIDLTEKGETIRDILFDKDTGIANRYLGDIKIFMGYVTNWDAKARADGGFDCSVEIFSQGSALLSYEHSKTEEKRNKLISLLDKVILMTTNNYFNIEFSDPDLKNKYRNIKDMFFGSDIYGVIVENLRENLKSSIFNRPNNIALKTGVYWHPDEGQSDFNDTNSIYVTFGLFEDLVLNKGLGFFSDDNSINSIWDSYNSIITFDVNLLNRQMFHKSSDLTHKFKFLYPWDWGKTAEGDTASEHYDNRFGTFSSNQPGKENYPALPGINENENIRDQHTKLGIIPLRELFISAGMIKRLLKSSNNVNDFMSRLLQEINDNSENIFDLRVASATDSADRCCVIDNNCLVGEKLNEEVTVSENLSTQQQDFVDKLFMFSPNSPNTIIKGYDMSMSTPSGDFQSMLAIQSGISGYYSFPIDEAMEIDLALKDLNITDETISYIPSFGIKWIEDDTVLETMFASQEAKNKNIAFGGNSGISNTITMPKSNRDIEIGTASDDVSNSSGNPLSINPTVLDEFSSDLQSDILNGKLPLGHNSGIYTIESKPKNTPPPKHENEPNSTNNPFAYWSKLARGQFIKSRTSIQLPITLSLQIYGISGLTIGNQVRVDSLPERYRDRVYFSITKVSHNVSNSAWSTTLEFVMKYLRQNRKYRGDSSIVLKDFVISRKWLDSQNLIIWTQRERGGGVSYSSFVKSLKPFITMINPNQIIGHPKIDYKFIFKARKSSFGRDGIPTEGTFPYSKLIKKYNTSTKPSWATRFFTNNSGELRDSSTFDIKFEEEEEYILIIFLGKYWIIFNRNDSEADKIYEDLQLYIQWYITDGTNKELIKQMQEAELTQAQHTQEDDKKLGEFMIRNIGG